MELEVKLPGGFQSREGWRRDALLRRLHGTDEAFLADEGASFSLAGLVTGLLTRCLRRLGPFDTVTPDMVRSLTVGDREALLLHLRRMELGGKIACVLRCPDAECGEKMDLDLEVSELLLPSYAFDCYVHEARVRTPEGEYIARFRLANGGDQEAATSLAQIQPESAGELILRRCVERVTESDSGQSVEVLEKLGASLAAEMARRDPQAEIILNLQCPACGKRFQVLFDAAAYVCKELMGRQRDFYQEIHLLAFYYHWSESEILALERWKRSVYLDLLAQSLRDQKYS